MPSLTRIGTCASDVSLHFPPPSEVQNEIRNDYRGLDALILRCLETEPEHRFADAGRLLAAIEACPHDAGAEVGLR